MLRNRFWKLCFQAENKVSIPIITLVLCVWWWWWFSHSVVSYSLQPHRVQPARLLCLWDFPGNTRVGCHFLFQGIFLTQELKLHLLLGKLILLPEPPGKPLSCIMSACVLRHFSHVQLFMIIWTAACQAPLSMGFFRQEYWGGLPCLAPGNFPNSGIELTSPASPALQILYP